jgi:hypothetical protein
MHALAGGRRAAEMSNVDLGDWWVFESGQSVVVRRERVDQSGSLAAEGGFGLLWIREI